MMTDPETSQPPPQPKVRLARLSGKATAAWLFVIFLVVVLLIPMAVRLPLWIDFQIVLAAWWLVWLAVLTRMLYMGQRVTADHELGAPRNWFGSAQKEPEKKDPLDIRKPEARKTGGDWSWLEFMALFGSGGGGEGCLFGIALIVGLIVLLGLIWFLIEIAIPVMFFVVYFTVRGMLAHVINDRHHCRSRLGRAFVWAFVWATAYTAPLAGVVWFVHYVHGLEVAA
jgi:hypothetical protein